MDEYSVIVDSKDNIIGKKLRSEIDLEKDIIRISAVWITNNKGDILLAKRSHHKKLRPGVWGAAAAGTVEFGESYEECMIRELEEEIGIKDISLQQGPKFFLRDIILRFNQFFFAEWNGKIEELILQEEEVEQAKWFTKKEFCEQIKEHPELFVESIVQHHLELMR